MRKIISILIVLILLIAIAFGIQKVFQEKVSVKGLLPENPIAFVHLKDTKENLKVLSQTPVWQTVSKIDYDALLKSSEASSAQLQYARLLIAQLTDPTNSMIISKLFGREVAVAVYETDLRTEQLNFQSADAMYGILENVLSSVFIVTRVPKDVQALEVFTGAFSSFGQNIKNETQDYRGLKIHVLTDAATGMRFSFARVNDLMVLGAGVGAVQKMWDVAKGDVTPLSEDQNIKQSVKKGISSPDISAFWDIEKFFSIFKKHSGVLMSMAGQGQGDTQQALDEAFKKMAGFKFVGVSAEIDKLMSAKFDLFFDKNLMDPDLADFYISCRSVKNETLSFVPQEALAYQWTNCFGLDYYWQQMKKEWEMSGKGASVNEAVRQFEDNFGLSIENDILAAFGTEMGGYLTEIKTGGLFPIPKIVLFLEIDDKNKAESLLNKLTTSIPMISFRQEEYQGFALFSSAMAFGKDFQPTYGFLDRYLVVAMSKDLIEGSIDVLKKDAPSIASAEDFKQVDFGLSDKSSSVYFMRVAAIADKVGNIINWSNKWIGAKQRQQQAFQQGAEQRLRDINTKIEEAETDLEDKNYKVTFLNEDIASFRAQGIDINEKQQELEEIQKQIEQLETEIAAGLEQKEELEGIVSGYKEKFPDTHNRQLILDEVVYPLLESFRSIRSFGSTAVVEDNAFETSVYMQMN